MCTLRVFAYIIHYLYNCTLFALKMAPVEGRNVCSMFLTSCLAVIFGLTLVVFSQLYRMPKYMNKFVQRMCWAEFTWLYY